ncbi:hypothetical protein M3Y99_01987300 [Aphelenchoides fujianensis]|nr:hypothetical protein M3Y99_01987300 [Aphelenchoides fujianensis]
MQKAVEKPLDEKTGRPPTTALAEPATVLEIRALNRLPLRSRKSLDVCKDVDLRSSVRRDSVHARCCSKVRQQSTKGYMQSTAASRARSVGGWPTANDLPPAYVHFVFTEVIDGMESPIKKQSPQIEVENEKAPVHDPLLNSRRETGTANAARAEPKKSSLSSHKEQNANDQKLGQKATAAAKSKTGQTAAKKKKPAAHGMQSKQDGTAKKTEFRSRTTTETAQEWCESPVKAATCKRCPKCWIHLHGPNANDHPNAHNKDPKKSFSCAICGISQLTQLFNVGTTLVDVQRTAVPSRVAQAHECATEEDLQAIVDEDPQGANCPR